MDELAEHFEEYRDHLTRVAYRMLGSTSEAEDVVQEAWLRLSRSDSEAIANFGGWLTTVVARVCLDQLRARRVHVQLDEDHWLPEAVVQTDDGPEEQATLADSVGVALLIVLETLTPAERLAFVLHDMFGIPFSEIGEILERSPDAARQLASRARRRMRGTPTITEPDLAQQRRLVSAFLAASREGDFDGLVAILDPDVVFRVRGREYADDVHGASHVARRVIERGTPLAPRGRPALINGAAGILVGAREHPVAVAAFTVANGKITSVDVILSPTLVD
jgi:RNA polymerase sigma-70 factor (ECF subfamily)